MGIQGDYEERVYAGVLGKIIGVYLGRPFEAWTYDRITADLGEVWYYVNDRDDLPLHNRILVVTDDDISGTFTFLRSLPDHGNCRELTPQQIGESWLNYIIDRRTILWWGGLGNSTEHTAYLRLKNGIPAPRSGSTELNGPVVAEQIGAQIFIDGWGMVAPGDPELAADLAMRAGSVSHDGEAVYGAQVVAAMEAQAFVEPDLNALVDTATRFIPADSVICRLIHDVREWHAAQPNDWRATRQKIVMRYGYDRYGGNCHIVPNHALIIHSLLHGDDDFQKSLMIVNTCGWDTDCNSGNVGCLLGIKNGLTAIDAGPDWRGPVADRMYLPTAEGGRAVTDAVTEAYHVVNVGRVLAGEQPIAVKGGARFHFELPGSVQGFRIDGSAGEPHVLSLENVEGHSQRGRRSLAFRFRGVTRRRIARATTPTFVPPEAIDMPGYRLLASPTLYPGQTVRARVEADASNSGQIACGLCIDRYGGDDLLVPVEGPKALLEPGSAHDFTWTVPSMDGQPVSAIGFTLSSDEPADGTVYVDYVAWDGAPDVILSRPSDGGTMWQRAWVDGMDQWEHWWPEAYRPIQNRGTGLLMQGTQEWTDYRVRATLTPHMVCRTGIAARVGGMRRYYALLLCEGGTARLVKAQDGESVLAETEFSWSLYRPYDFVLEITGTHICGSINGQWIFDLEDTGRPLLQGGVGLVVTEGRVGTDAVVVEPVHR